MTVEQITTLIGQLGFPIFVAGYMLIKQSKDTENMISILSKLQSTIETLANKIERDDKS
jgi:uroporphyrinogen-III decarboxylase